MEHSREPWREGTANSIVSDDAAGPMVNGAEMVQHYGGYMVAESVAPENRRRIVACVNACAGIRTEVLEDGARHDWGTLMQGLENQRDRAERALRRAGWTYTEGAEEWRPPLGPSPSPLLARIDKLQALSVENILIDVVPGHDGMGQEVYASSVSDVRNLLIGLSRKVESLEAQRDQLLATVGHVADELGLVDSERSYAPVVAKLQKVLAERNKLLAALEDAIDDEPDACFAESARALVSSVKGGV